MGFFLAFILAGCATGAPDDIKSLISDPHYSTYQKNLDELESSYLKGQMKYSDYATKKKQLEDEYNKEVKERENILSNTTPEGLSP